MASLQIFVDSNILKIEYIYIYILTKSFDAFHMFCTLAAIRNLFQLTWSGITAESCSAKCHIIDASFLAAGVSAWVQSTCMHGVLTNLGMFVCVGWAIGWVNNEAHIKLHVDICIYILT